RALPAPDPLGRADLAAAPDAAVVRARTGSGLGARALRAAGRGLVCARAARGRARAGPPGPRRARGLRHPRRVHAPVVRHPMVRFRRDHRRWLTGAGPAPEAGRGPPPGLNPPRAHRPPASFTEPGPGFAETRATARAAVRNFPRERWAAAQTVRGPAGREGEMGMGARR